MDQEIVLYRASALEANGIFLKHLWHLSPVSPVRGFSDPDEVVIYRPIIIIRQDCLWLESKWQENGAASEQIPMLFQVQWVRYFRSILCFKDFHSTVSCGNLLLRLDKCRLFEKLEARIPCLRPNTTDFDLNVTSFSQKTCYFFAPRCFYTLLHPAPPP